MKVVTSVSGPSRSVYSTYWYDLKKFYFANLATGHFSGKFFLKVSTSGYEDSNYTRLKSLSCPGAEPIKIQTNKQILDIII